MNYNEKPLKTHASLQVWLRRMMWLLIVLMIPNLIYGSLLYMPKPHVVIPAEALELAHLLEQSEIEGQSLYHMAQCAYQDIQHYMLLQRSGGNIFHSTTLGVFQRDEAMADYVYAHQQATQINEIPVISLNEQSVDLTVVVYADIQQALSLFATGLKSHHPLRYRQLVKAEQILREVLLLLDGKVGERGHGVSLTLQILKKK